MNLGEINNMLTANLGKEPTNGKTRNIIFWYDSEGEFQEDIESLELDNAKILILSDNNSFNIKYQLEEQDTISNYLIYANTPKPIATDNWLLDILKYSSEFSTDKATVIMKELEIADEDLRDTIKKYIKFFNNKTRYNKFISYSIDNYTEETIEIAILSVLCRQSMQDFEQVIKNLIIDEIEQDNKYIQDIEKFADTQTLWKWIEKKHGFNMQEKTLKNLMLMYIITDISSSIETTLPKAWQKYISPKKADATIFINHFRNHVTDREYYDELANQIESTIQVKPFIQSLETEQLLNCETFKEIDEEIISRLIKHILENVRDYETYRKIINKRKSMHWYPKYEATYEAIYYAIELLKQVESINKTIKGNSAYEYFNTYVNQYYLIDTYYRKFCLSYNRTSNQEPLIEISDKIENLYTNWYLEELSMKWTSIFSQELKNSVEIEQIIQQHNFYNHYVKSYVKKNDRVIVIISDALRYEIAAELVEFLNIEARGSAKLTHMQGVIPTYTKLGMASLLPHKSININDKAEVIIDNINSQGTENRGKILENYSKESIAITYNTLKTYNKQQYRDVFQGKKLIYIYHNLIDAIGDKATTEKDVFEAVEKTFEELKSLIKNLNNNISAIKIYITSDHGFIYRRKALSEYDKIPRISESSIDKSRRFILTEKKEPIEGTTIIPMQYILEETKLNAVIPNGVIRFKVQGAGENFVHGGISLQELVIPVIKFKYIRKEEYKQKKVEIKLVNITRKITNRITFLEFFQVDLVEDKKVARRLKLYFVDEDNNRISNENIIIADSTSQDPKNRTFKEKFTLKDLLYDKTKEYYLIVEDEEETVDKIIDKIPFSINLVIMNDFGF